MAVFESVERIAHRALISAVADRAHKRGRSQPADAAKARRDGWLEEIFPAAGTAELAPAGEFRPANLADRGRGQMGERHAAQKTVGRKERAAQRVTGISDDSLRRNDYRAPSRSPSMRGILPGTVFL
jgi:hypothetical protein